MQNEIRTIIKDGKAYMVITPDMYRDIPYVRIIAYITKLYNSADDETRAKLLDQLGIAPPEQT